VVSLEPPRPRLVRARIAEDGHPVVADVPSSRALFPAVEHFLERHDGHGLSERPVTQRGREQPVRRLPAV
jgi:hypothetical protein